MRESRGGRALGGAHNNHALPRLWLWRMDMTATSYGRACRRGQHRQTALPRPSTWQSVYMAATPTASGCGTVPPLGNARIIRHLAWAAWTDA